MSATAVLTVWYNLPLHFMHRAILLGFTTYSIIFATLYNILHSFGARRMWETIGFLDVYAYLALVTWWAFTAWRSGEAIEIAPVRAAVLAPKPA
jgi:hypothetical protein